MKLGKAFQNYRRTILHMLRRACLLKRIFGIWRSVRAPAAPDVHDLILTEDDMSHFLKKVASFEAHVANRQLVKAARADRRHQDHGKAMPRLISASLIKLWQVCLSHEHAALLEKYFGGSSRHLAGAPSTRIREDCWNQEFQQRAEALSRHVSARQRIMTKLEEQTGAKLWAYLVERSQKLVAHVYKEKASSGSRAAGAAGLPEDSVVADSAASTEPAAAAAVSGVPTPAERLRPEQSQSAGGVPPSSVECVRSAEQTARDVGANRHLQTENATLNAAIASLDCPPPAVANVHAASREIDFIFKRPETAQVPLNPPPRNLS